MIFRLDEITCRAESLAMNEPTFPQLTCVLHAAPAPDEVWHLERARWPDGEGTFTFCYRRFAVSEHWMCSLDLLPPKLCAYCLRHAQKEQPEIFAARPPAGQSTKAGV